MVVPWGDFRAYQDFRLARQYFVTLFFNDSCIFFTHSFLRCRTPFGCFCGKSGQKPLIPIWKVYTILLPAVNTVDACNTDQRSLKFRFCISKTHQKVDINHKIIIQASTAQHCQLVYPLPLLRDTHTVLYRRSCESSVFEIVLPLCFLLQ